MITLATLAALALAATDPAAPSAAPPPPPPTSAAAPAPALSPAPILAPAPAPAEPEAVPATPPAGPTMTLEDALRRADEANLDLKAARARIAEARAGVWKAWSGYLPQLTAGASATRNDVPVSLGLPTAYAVRARTGSPGEPPPDPAGLPGAVTNDFIAPFNFETITIQKTYQYAAQADLHQALLAPELWMSIKGAYTGEEANARSVEAARRQVLFSVAQAYYGVASLRKLTDVQRQLLGIARRQEHDATIRYRAGTIAKVGLLRAEIDRAQAEQDLLRARNGYESARIALATLLDRQADFEVAEPPEPVLPGDTTRLQDDAVRDRPDLQAARLQVDTADYQKRATAMRYLPAIGLFGHVQWSNVLGFTGRYEDWAVGVALTWNILDGGLREAQLREASARIVEADEGRRSAEAKAQAEVQQALLDLESARANAIKAKEQRDLAAENERLIDVSYRAGAATAVEQADAVAALRNAEISLSSETLAAQLAAVRVLQSAGAYDPVPVAGPR